MFVYVVGTLGFLNKKRCDGAALERHLLNRHMQTDIDVVLWGADARGNPVPNIISEIDCGN